MAKVRGQNRFFETQTFRQGFPPVLEPTTVALLPNPYPDGAIAPVTDDPDNPVYVRKLGAWVPLGGSGSDPDISTKTNLTFPVDYNDVTAVDPPSGTTFAAQSDINDFLTGAGTLNFKHVQAAWDSVPLIVKHNVVINLAAGIHRAQAGGKDGFYAFGFVNKLLAGGCLQILGVLPSQWALADPTLTGLVVDSFSNANSDPWLDFSSSNPGIFTGMDLRGQYVVLDTGQVDIIVRHTNDRLYVVAATSPVPTPSVTTVKVAHPASILRPTLDDINPVTTYGGALCSVQGTAYPWGTWPTPSPNFFEVNDITYQAAPSYDFGWTVGGASSVWNTSTRIFIDAKTLPGGSTPYGLGAYNTATFFLGDVSIIAPRAGYGTPISLWSSSNLQPWNCYIQGFGAPILIDESSSFRATSMVVDAVGGLQDDVSIAIMGGVYQFDPDIWTGRNCEINNTPAGVVGLRLSRRAAQMNTWNSDSGQPNVNITFRNCQGPCVEVKDVDLDLTWTDWGGGIRDGGGNTNVGIKILGPNASVSMKTGTTVTGTLGDVLLADGETWSYADIYALGPITDDFGNLVRKD